MTIPALPPLDRTSPTFRTDLDTFFLTQLPATVTALNSELTRIDGILPAGYVATSTTSLTVSGSGVITPTVQTNKGFAPGQFVVISVTADPAVQMGGTVTAYDYTTGVLSVSVSQSAGTGTYAAWTVALSAAAAGPYEVGDLLLTNRTLTAPAWLPADGAIYSQSTYPGLYAELGLLRNGLRNVPKRHPTITSKTSITPVSNSLRKSQNPFVHTPVATPTVYVHNYTTAATPYTNTLHRSTDGVTWTSASIPNLTTTYVYTGIAAIGQTMIMNSNTPAPTQLAHSTDGGATWSTLGVTGAAAQVTILTFNNMFILADSGSTTYYTSSDGVAWAARTTPVALKWYQHHIGNGTLAMLKQETYPTTPLYTTTDGINWTARTLPAGTMNAYLGPVHIRDGIWIITEHAGYTTYLCSTDNCVTWTRRGISTAPDFIFSYYGFQYYEACVFNNTLYGLVGHVASGAKWLVSTSDGINWALIRPTSAGSLWVVGSELWLAATAGSLQGDSEFTTDLKTWTPGSLSYEGLSGFPQEIGNYQISITGPGVTNLLTRRVCDYDIATQFAVPLVKAEQGTKAYIKT